MKRSGWVNYEQEAYCVGCRIKQNILQRFCIHCGKLLRHNRRRLSGKRDHVRY